MRTVSRIPIATRLWCAISVPLLVAGVALGSQFLQARSVADHARDQLTGLQVISAMTQMQAGPVQPEVLADGPFQARSTGSLDTRLGEVVLDQIWSNTTRDAARRITEYERVATQNPSAIPPEAADAFETEIALIRQLIDQPRWASKTQIAQLTLLRTQADAQLTDLGMSLSTAGWITYQERVDVDRASSVEFFGSLVTLAGMRRPDPTLLSARSGARANAVSRMGLSSGPIIRQHALDLTTTTEYKDYETDMARAVQVAAGTKPPDDVQELARTATNASGLHDQIALVADEGTRLVNDTISTQLKNAQGHERQAAIFSVLVLLITAGVGAAALHSVLRPLRDLTSRARDLASGNLDGTPVIIAGRHELAQLAIALEGSALTLQKIREQSEAIAGGHLDDPCLDRSAVGALGTLMHRSVEAVRGMAAQLQQQADFDPLTGLMNRNAVEKWFAGIHVPHLVLYLDLDGFKAVNDTQGHGAGDQLLAAVALRLRHLLRPTDMVARLGGDEFLVAIPEDMITHGEADVAHVTELVGRVRQKISEPVDDLTQVGVSIGWTLWTPGETLEDALARADAAMYEMKRRNTTADRAQGPRNPSDILSAS